MGQTKIVASYGYEGLKQMSLEYKRWIMRNRQKNKADWAIKHMTYANVRYRGPMTPGEVFRKGPKRILIKLSDYPEETKASLYKKLTSIKYIINNPTYSGKERGFWINETQTMDETKDL